MRCEVYREVAASIDALPLLGPKIVGVNGVDTSGKTIFASGLTSYLASRGSKVAVIHMDDFHNPKSIRSRGTDPVSSYIDNAFNVSMLENEILRPIKQAGNLDKSLVLLDLETDTYSALRRFVVDPETVVILEGVLLYRPPIDQYFDLRIFLDIPFEEVIRRASIRDASPGDASIVDRYHSKYIPVQKRYLAEHSPAQRADLVVDNTDYGRPRIIGVV